MVLDSLERGHLHQLEMGSGGKGGLSAILRERWGKGCSSSTMAD